MDRSEGWSSQHFNWEWNLLAQRWGKNVGYGEWGTKGFRSLVWKKSVIILLVQGTFSQDGCAIPCPAHRTNATRKETLYQGNQCGTRWESVGVISLYPKSEWCIRLYPLLLCSPFTYKKPIWIGSFSKLFSTHSGGSIFPKKTAVPVGFCLFLSKCWKCPRPVSYLSYALLWIISCCGPVSDPLPLFPQDWDMKIIKDVSLTWWFRLVKVSCRVGAC